MSALDDAEKLLLRLDSVQLASLTEAGYPCVRDMELRTRDGLREFCFFTRCDSNKARQFAANSKAGVSFCVGDDCVSLVGDVAVTEGAQRPGFCKLVFTSVSGTAWIGGELFPMAFPRPRRKKTLYLPQALEPQRRHPCPCCGFYTFPVPREAAIAYICPVCFWENDVFDPGADQPSDENRGMTLREGRENYKKWGAVREEFISCVRPPQLREFPEHP